MYTRSECIVWTSDNQPSQFWTGSGYCWCFFPSILMAIASQVVESIDLFQLQEMVVSCRSLIHHVQYSNPTSYNWYNLQYYCLLVVLINHHWTNPTHPLRLSVVVLCLTAANWHRSGTADGCASAGRGTIGGREATSSGNSGDVAAGVIQQLFG